MRKISLTLLLATLLLSLPNTARADLIEVWAAPLVGGGFGNGKSDYDFFDWAGGGAAGVEGGIEILFISAYVEYLRFFGGDADAGLLSVNLGGDSEFSITDNLKIVLRLAGGYFWGDLDDATRVGTAVTTRSVNTDGIGIRGGLGPRYDFLKIFSIGITPQIGYHYFWNGGEDVGAVSAEDSHGWNFQALAYGRIALGI